MSQGRTGNTKMLQYINWKMKVTITDTRMLIGTFIAFDKHMNIVLTNCDEFRTIKAKKNIPKRQQKRTLGLVLLRGENIVSLTPVAPPLPKNRLQSISKGPSNPPTNVNSNSNRVPSHSQQQQHQQQQAARMMQHPMPNIRPS